jgi:hypothetical protein
MIASKVHLNPSCCRPVVWLPESLTRLPGHEEVPSSADRHIFSIGIALHIGKGSLIEGGAADAWKNPTNTRVIEEKFIKTRSIMPFSDLSYFSINSHPLNTWRLLQQEPQGQQNLDHCTFKVRS